MVGDKERRMKQQEKRLLAGLLLLAGGAWGCDRGPPGWTPVLEETSTVFLETEVDRLADRVETAREQLATDPSAAENALVEASSALEHLRHYYLPLFQARERAYNAYRAFYLGDRSRMTEELQKIEGILGSMALGTQGGRLQEVQALAEALADARVAVESGGQGGAQALEALARSLNRAALKGDLILIR
jgi:hypothetical protein